MTARAFIAVVLVLALAPAASAAQRRPRFYHLGVGAGPAVTDGKRYVAFPLDESSAAFYDFGVRSPSESILRAPPCVESQRYSYPSSLDSVGDREVLWDCVSVTEGPLLEDVATTHVSQIPRPPEILFGDAEDAFRGTIGTSWIGVWMDDHGVSYPGYYNRDSGAWRREPTSASRYPNLDDPALAETLCRPLGRSPTPPDYSDVVAAPFEPYFYEHQYGVTIRAHERITAQRCGSRKISVVGRCKLFCLDVQFSAGLITWADGRSLRAYAPRTGTRYTWPAATLPNYGSSIWFAHTRQRLIASTLSQTSARHWDIWAARMPKH